jgi:hypothetical protein
MRADDNGNGLDRTIPEGVQVAGEVDQGAEDPALGEDGVRRCIALTRAGERCLTRPALDLVLCNAHAGRLDPRKGGQARARKLRLVAERAMDRRAEAALGTRAVVAAALREKHDEIRAAIHLLADQASAGDRQAALALIPWINQGLGLPAAQAGLVTDPNTGEQTDLSALSTAQLKALLASHPSRQVGA